jgi:hypothetical protein
MDNGGTIVPDRSRVSSAAADTAADPCPLCRRHIAAGDSAARHDRHVLHLDCYIAVLRTSGDLLAYLKARAGAPYCMTCLVNAIGVTFDEVALAHAWVRSRPGIRVAVMPCAGCGGRRVTLAWESAAPVESLACTR